jgi:acetolactate synthase-1/2/3 large subunit
MTNGAESLIGTAARAGVEVCFANPGTTEMQLVAALDAVTGVRPVLALFEGVCTGAADGYARMAGKPALTLLHLGPGFANGIANLHNARRAHTPLVNLIGDHASWHLAADAPLTSDIESLARPVSRWVRSATSAKELSGDFAEAIAAACAPPGGVATLIVPQDCQWEAADAPAPPVPIPAPAPVADTAVAAAAGALAAGSGLLYLGGAALGEGGLRAAARVAAATGCGLLHETFSARLERGVGLPVVDRLPYFPEQAAERLGGVAHLVVAGTREPVSFFGYPEMPSRLAPEGAEVTTLAAPDTDVVGALEALADRLGADAEPPLESGAGRPDPPTGALTAGSLGQALAALQPEGAIVVDEGATSGLAWIGMGAHAPRHTVLSLTGGAIGQGLPCAVVDHGARGAGRGDDRLCEPRLPDPAGRARPRGHRRARTGRAGADGSRPPGARLGGAGKGHGGAGRARRQRRCPGGGPRARLRRAGPGTRRGADLSLAGRLAALQSGAPVNARSTSTAISSSAQRAAGTAPPKAVKVWESVS